MGVYHNFQTEYIEEFEKYVIDICNTYSIKSIAEEMNQDALNEFSASESTIKIIADKLKLPHAYCDPDKDQRTKLGIICPKRREYQKLFNNWPENKSLEYSRTDCKKREGFWLKCLKVKFRGPMLFVCGIDHLNTFPKILIEQNFKTIVLDKKWIPNKLAERN